ncbi:MAG: Fic family protein [Pseudomonadota bacterium]|nr:Fic family protein [Pseudomonadota bacterium]
MPPGWDQMRAEVIEGSHTLGEAIVSITGERRGLPDLPRPRAVGIDRYIDPVTKVAYNKLGLRRRSELAAVDYKMTDVRLAQSMLEPVRGLYDLDHLERLHRQIFSDLYDWAGEYRRIDFSRVLNAEPGWKARFAPVDEIAAVAAAMRSQLGVWNTLKGLVPADLLARLTAIYIQLNYMHPFLKGNGRAIAALLSQLAHEARYELRFENVEPEVWSRATAYSMPRIGHSADAQKLMRDETLIRGVFARIVVPMGDLD